MEAVRQVVDSSLLKDVLTLPRGFQNKKVEVIVLLQEEASTKPKLSGLDMTDMLKGSITESLIGVIPKADSTLDEYRADRLTKHDKDIIPSDPEYNKITAISELYQAIDEGISDIEAGRVSDFRDFAKQFCEDMKRGKV